MMCVMAILLLAAGLVACNKKGDKLPDDYRYVTFDYNVAGLETSSVPQTQYIAVKQGGLVSIRPGFNNRLEEQTVINYYIKSWNVALATDENGEPEKDENGRVKLGRAWDFATDRVQENITLYANLIKSPVMRFIDADTNEEVSTIDGKRPGTIQRQPSASYAPRKSGYTFMGSYYADKGCTREFDWTDGNGGSFRFGDDDVDVYVKFIEGEWVLVSDLSGLISAFNTGSNIYLLNDIVLEESMQGQSYASNWSPNSYNGVFNGNNHTIKNIHVYREASRKTNTNFGIFGRLGARAHVYDLKIENATVEVYYADSSAGFIDVGLFAWQADDNARIENVQVRNSKIILGYSVDYNAYPPQLFDKNRMTPYEFIGKAGQAQEAAYQKAGCSWDVKVERYYDEIEEE